jgi:2-polyprenyl-3-methyl-5-hydroxy-6-metoxy-1,4-benzoquinol methylase
MREPNQFSHQLRLPATHPLQQREEWCEVAVNGQVQHVRFHDYARVYAIPGLYEQLFQGELGCDSPRIVCSLLDEVLSLRGVNPSSLRVLDVGAGNGMVAESLLEIGVNEIVGIDILPDAAAAAVRDRPGVYRDYLVADLTSLTTDTSRKLGAARFNCVTAVGVLGFDDVSPSAFAAALSYVATPGWIAFNIKERFLSEIDETGFGDLIARCFSEGGLSLVTRLRHRHRYAVTGEPLHYVAVIAEKQAEIAEGRPSDHRSQGARR